ncbi:hypothetical protein [Chryseobacterium viscerum]|uniref:Uncharacterized protein n=1 Tax=Chryseobacterium viscerum TaxID=1037377 RepID=A0A316WCG7_9FLAO|nr:hypothetical protein [Chryseobacterium viscerum]PWN58997.1 hypothetical protein C1634_020500 [Chryseobacterium viscerum]
MKNENQFLQEISYLIKIFDGAFFLLHNDKFHYGEAQMKKLYKSKEISEELDEKNFDVFFMQLANEGFKEIIFNDLIGKISKYNDLVFEKKVITNDRFLNFYFENIPELRKIQQWVKLKEREILEVEQYNSGMAQLEKQNIINELEKELFHLEQEKERIYNKYSWVKTNYYFKILNKADEIIEKIGNYFKVSLLKSTNEIFDSKLTKRIFETMIEEKYINSKSQLTSENFHLILNLKTPKQSCTNALKVTHFGYLFKLLSDDVEKKGFKKQDWENFVIKEFNLRVGTLESRFYRTDKNKIFDEIINS